MILATLLAIAVQASAPTVGDTIWIRREVPVPVGRTVRPADWVLEDSVELLGPPRLSLRGGTAEIAYPVVVWVTGELTLRPPGPLLLGPDGTVDSLPSEPVTFRVASVLPAVRPDSGLRPQPRAAYVARSDRTLWPLVLLWLLAAGFLAPLHWWWRRRGAPRPQDSPLGALSAPLPLERWAGAGESRAVAAAASGRLRTLVAARVPGAHAGLDTEAVLDEVRKARPEWPLEELGRVLRSLDEARFGHRAGSDALDLARRAGELEPRLRAEAAA